MFENINICYFITVSTLRQLSKIHAIHRRKFTILLDFLDSFFDGELGVSRVINIHPSLLPSFPGKNAYEQAYYSGIKMSGVTVHFVDSGIDTGPPILQECFPRFETDTLDEFVARGLETEYQLYRQAIRCLIEKRISLLPIEGSEKSIVNIERY